MSQARQKRKAGQNSVDQSYNEDEDKQVPASRGIKKAKAIDAQLQTASTSVPTLRAVPPSARLFWKDTIQEQLSQGAKDRYNRGILRDLTKHEITTMALNEVAAELGRGFFFYLPSREVWKTPASESMIPRSRVPEYPGAAYPSIVMMDFVWDDNVLTDFLSAGHRARYLKCNALLNHPAPATPLYAIQYVAATNFPLYVTRVESIVVLARPAGFQASSTRILEETFGRKTRVRGGVEPESRIELPSTALVEGVEDVPTFDSIKYLYDELIDICVHERLPATFDQTELQASIVPRASGSDAEATAKPLGTPFAGEVATRAGPPTRIGKKYGQRRKKARNCVPDGGETEEDVLGGDAVGVDEV